MCPLCIGTATLLVSGGTSAGGLAAFLFRRRAGKKGSLAPPADSHGRQTERLTGSTSERVRSSPDSLEG